MVGDRHRADLESLHCGAGAARHLLLVGLAVLGGRPVLARPPPPGRSTIVRARPRARASWAGWRWRSSCSASRSRPSAPRGTEPADEDHRHHHHPERGAQDRARHREPALLRRDPDPGLAAPPTAPWNWPTTWARAWSKPAGAATPAQKNWAAEQASHDWILSLDADEALSEALEGEIWNLKKYGPRYDAYTMPRLAQYLGRWILHSGWYPDRKVRLYHREQGELGRRFRPREREGATAASAT